MHRIIDHRGNVRGSGYRAGMAAFDEATAVRRVGADGALTRYVAELDPEWRVGTKPNGGYLLAILSRAALDVVDGGPGGHPHPVAVSAHFLTAPDAGPAEVEVELLRRGRSASQVRATLLAGHSRCVEALVTCGELPAAAEPWRAGPTAPELPPLDACPRATEGPVVPVPLLNVIEERLDPVSAGFATGRPSMQGEIRAWVRLADGQPADPLSLLVFADCLPPATFDLGLLGAWVPTLELTVYLRGVPAPGPLRARLRAGLVVADRVDEHCDVWDSAGRLVATGHQLAGVRVPERPPDQAR
jgi:hypothetical protein